jgi:hypothetical protein
MAVGLMTPMAFVAQGIVRDVMIDGVVAIVAIVAIVATVTALAVVTGIVLPRVIEGAKEVYDRDADAEDGKGDIDSLEGNHDRVRV